MKKGRFSTEEMSFIEAKAEVLSPDDIASQLDRDPKSIREWIGEKIGFSAKQKKEAAVANELKSKPYYKELIHQFSSEELEMFEFHFKKMWSQFKDDVFHTEEMQIIDTIVTTSSILNCQGALKSWVKQNSSNFSMCILISHESGIFKSIESS